MKSVVFTICLFILGLIFSTGFTSLSQAEHYVVNNPATEVGLTLGTTTPADLTINYAMTSYALDAITLRGETSYKVSLADVFLPNSAGAPDLPGLSRFIAIPRGAVATVEIISSTLERRENISIAPAPVIPFEDDDAPLVYEKNNTIFNTDTLYPTSPATLSATRRMRGVEMVCLNITPFQYNPITRELLIYTRLEIKVSFEGGTNQLVDNRLRNRYWEPVLARQLINYNSLPTPDFNLPRDENDYGWEYVIITPEDGAFIAWADTLKTWRQKQGISTEIFTTGDTGTSEFAIENWLNNAYLNWDIPPVAFLILADYPSSGFRTTGITSPIYDDYCASDNIYADVDGDDLPDMFHARICAQNEFQLQTMINKMLTHERAPTTNPGFYDHPVIAGGWQEERWFILCTEIVHGYLVNEQNKNPIREYAIYEGIPGSNWSTAPNTSQLLSYFGDNGLGYVPPTADYLDDWGANATRVNNDINEGTFMVLHRDHGNIRIWGEPYYHANHVNDLMNDEYPFIFSINCLTGKFQDSSYTSLAESFHRSQSAALGVIAATESSQSFVNDTFIFGLMDGLWPDFMPAEGQASFEYSPMDLRPALSMVNGKYFLEGSSWPYNQNAKAVTHHLFHHHGDAFIQMYSEVPANLTVSHADTCYIGDEFFTVTADEGSIIALTINGEIASVAGGTGLPIEMPIPPQQDLCEICVTATKANYYRYNANVPIVPMDGPYFVIDTIVIDDDMIGDTAGNANNLCDSGETVGFNISLENVGTASGVLVTAVLSSDDPLCTVLNNNAEYGLIPAGSVGDMISEPYLLQINSACPDNHEIEFMLTISSANQPSWVKSFSLNVSAPVFEFVDYSIDDSIGGNGDGRIDTGETFTLLPTIRNSGATDASNLNIHLVLCHPELSIPVNFSTLISLPAGETLPLILPFEVTVGADYPTPDLLYPSLAVRADWGQQKDLAFEIPVGSMFDTMENGVGTWTHDFITPEYVDQWHLSAEDNYSPNGSHCWKHGGVAPDTYAIYSDGALYTESFYLSGAGKLTFWHKIDAEESYSHSGQGYDGGLIEVKIGEADWTQYTPENGYNRIVRLRAQGPGPFPWETPFFSGTFDWREDSVLIDAEGEWVQIRFRFGSDYAVNLTGWFIDDVMITSAGEPFSETEDQVPLQLYASMAQNQPNPFNGTTSISYHLPGQREVELNIFDTSGRLVRTLFSGEQQPGAHLSVWDGKNNTGELVGSGLYFYQLTSSGITRTRKMILTR